MLGVLLLWLQSVCGADVVWNQASVCGVVDVMVVLCDSLIWDNAVCIDNLNFPSATRRPSAYCHHQPISFLLRLIYLTHSSHRHVSIPQNAHCWDVATYAE
jgi:hypothetical protein